MDDNVNKETTLDYLGVKYEEKLINQIIIDQKFGNNIIDIVSPNYFSNDESKLIISLIKQSKKDYNVIPDFDSLSIRAAELGLKEIKQNYLIKTIAKIKELVVHDALYIQDVSKKFFKQQEINKAVQQIQKIISKHQHEKYDECLEILKTAISYGNTENDGIDILHNITEALADDFRNPIRTGITKLDEVMNGGLSKSELGLILAPFGVGKTTLITKIANTAYNDGYKVLQIFFEDKTKIIQRKHLACWTGIELNELHNHKEEVFNKTEEMKKNGGRLVLLKLPSDGITMPMIRKHIEKKISEGFRPDIVLLDYIDCVSPSKEYTDVFTSEGAVMRQFETILSDFDMAGWTCVQGNRCVWVNEKVTIEGKGLIPIGEVKKGDKILTHKGNKEVTFVFPITKQAVYRIKTKSGKTITVSAKHMFPTSNGKFESIETGLNIGHKLLIQK